MEINDLISNVKLLGIKMNDEIITREDEEKLRELLLQIESSLLKENINLSVSELSDIINISHRMKVNDAVFLRYFYDIVTVYTIVVLEYELG